ncbi:MAG: small conductance mechanosensitive channel [Solirubrobacteraceae bacterium]|jgi:small-conductance mechanosensitive channel|nr:small conductance mechanosensitive channel [Solirubrobacteraceae bacterium]MEA2241105.1 small conductance mechanosensitive channel [Solirubrobacteraceae bacterium]
MRPHSGEPERPWFDLAAARELSHRAIKRARIESVVLLPAMVGVVALYAVRDRLFPASWDTAIRLLTAVAIVALGWQLARSAGRALRPWLFQRMKPDTAGTVGFLIRLTTMAVVVVAALRIAGLGPSTLAVGSAVTAVVVGLAAQQTLGNVIAGSVLASARPFRVGDRVRLQGGGLAGTVEGTVTSLGLLYTTLAQGADEILVPNALVMNVAVVPLREPDGINVRARLRAGITPSQVEGMLSETLRTPLSGSPHVALEEIDADEVVVRISASPLNPADGPRLASEVLEALASYAAGETEEERRTA